MSAPRARAIFGDTERLRIRQAVEAAELRTSGEIRVFIEDECKTDPLERAAFVFNELDMHETDLRNGVLIYVAVAHKKFAIIGDAGIHSKVGNDFWEKVRNKMTEHFRTNAFVEGIEHGVHEAGEVLSAYFPYIKGSDKNELPDDLVFGNQ